MITPEAIIKIVTLGIETLTHLKANHDAAAGKSQGEELREALTQLDANDVEAAGIIRDALARTAEVEHDPAKVEANLAEMRALLGG
jgi:hypothetical protein